MPTSNPSVRCKANSFEFNYQLIWGICLGIAKRWTNYSSAITAEDLAQVALIKIWEKYPEYDAGRPLSSFVRTVAVRAIQDYCKSPDNYLFESFDEMVIGPSSSSKCDKLRPVRMEKLEDVENLPKVYVAHLMAWLTDRQFKVIEQSFGVGDCDFERSDASIAENLKVTRQTVVSDRRQAMKTMRIRAEKKEQTKALRLCA